MGNHAPKTSVAGGVVASGATADPAISGGALPGTPGARVAHGPGGNGHADAESATQVRQSVGNGAQGQAAVSPAPAAAAEATSTAETPNGSAGKRLPLPRFLQQTPSWLISLVVHMAALVVLTLWTIEPPDNTKLSVLVSPPPEAEPLETDIDDQFEKLELDSFDILDPMPQTAPEVEIPNNPLENELEAAPLQVELSDVGEFQAAKEDLLKTIGAYGGLSQGVGGRSGKVKDDLVRRGGGNDASEAAVRRALKWLKEHQMPDGGWTFDLEACPKCKGRCSGSRSRGGDVRLAATSMALLPFLGAGHTHKEGEYQDVVERGLYYLTSKMVNTGNGLSMFERNGGSMYSHGLGSIVLCEAYAMTNDRTLVPYAQGAVQFITYAQDQVGGGWRYEAPSTNGDTSVAGWQIMALKSARLAYVPLSDRLYRKTLRKAEAFLDSVQTEGGAAYGYTRPEPRASTTAIGLLCRMYMGWTRDNPALGVGVRALSRRGPSHTGRGDATDLYYDYYATQVMRHWGGKEWEKWNKQMRDWLIDEQSRKGHENGSWHTNDRWITQGGRLYCTSLATLTLEVYYRHLPLFGGEAVEDEFAAN